MQSRRYATAIATRIAEACGREATVDFAADLRRSVSASNEVEYLLLLAKDLEYLNEETYDKLAVDVINVRKMICGLLRKL